jgi:anti-sigma factor RsiW
MTCARHDFRLLLHAHRQLGGPERLLAEGHLRRCPACRDRWARMVLERDALRRAAAPQLEDDPGAERMRLAVAIRIRTEGRDAGALPARRTGASVLGARPARLLLLSLLLVSTGVAAIRARRTAVAAAAPGISFAQPAPSDPAICTAVPYFPATGGSTVPTFGKGTGPALTGARCPQCGGPPHRAP